MPIDVIKMNTILGHNQDIKMNTILGHNHDICVVRVLHLLHRKVNLKYRVQCISLAKRTLAVIKSDIIFSSDGDCCQVILSVEFGFG